MKTFQTSRSIPATVEQVFAAFSDPVRLARWWGPAGFTNTFHECEFKNGGRWLFIMHGPDGTDYNNENVFVDINAPNTIAIQHVSAPRFLLTINLTAEGEGTRLSWVQEIESEEFAIRVEHIIVPANEQNLDRLTAEVLRFAR